MENCKICGDPFNGLGTCCRSCLNKSFYLAALDQQVKIFAEAPDLAVLVTKRNPPQIAHLALIGHQSMAFCGMLLQSRAWSEIGPADEFKRNTCQKCLELFVKITGRNRAVRQ